MHGSTAKKILRTTLVAGAFCAVAITTTACQPKKGTVMNKCSCACRQESSDTVLIANKDFFSEAACGSFEGQSCDVKVSTSSGDYTVSGKWEGCTSNGKATVSILESPEDVPTVAVSEDDVLPPPTPPPTPTPTPRP
jgi:hypothetical protein